MRKLILVCSFLLSLSLIPCQGSAAQIDSTCQIFGDGGTLSIIQGTVKRFYTKYIPGATYSWTITGGNIMVVGPRNLHYVDIMGVSCGTAKLCISYSIDGQDPCCKCEDITVTGCTPPPPPSSCCINYMNATMQYPWIKVKYQTCGPGITSVKLFRWNGSAYVLLDTDLWSGGCVPNYTYNLDIYWNNFPFGCHEIFCLKICGYKADGTECCTSNFAIRADCDAANNFSGVTDIAYPGCNAPNGGGGGGGVDYKKSGGSTTITEASKLLLAPNPASHTLQIGFPEQAKINTLLIIDEQGNKVKAYTVKEKASLIISVADLAPGVYFVKPDDPNIEAVSFIKQ